MHKSFLFIITLALAGICFSSLYLGHFPHYTPDQVIPIFLLLALFVSVRGIETSGLLRHLSKRLEEGTLPAPKLVILSFVLSGILSIDVTLVTLLPMVLSMRIKERDTLVLLVAFTAHVGAALMPFGTPQNLFIFSFYHLHAFDFIRVIAPFCAGLFTLLLTLSFFLPVTPEAEIMETATDADTLRGILYLLFLTVTILAVLRICPWYTAALVLLYTLIWDRSALKIDYLLLLTFLLFLGMANNLRQILSHWLEHPTHIFWLSSLLSQGISNVPTTLLLHHFTPEWETLLWGTNVGGFGTPVAALANLITYRLYATKDHSLQSRKFLWKMTYWGFLLYIVGAGLYFAVMQPADPTPASI